MDINDKEELPLLARQDSSGNTGCLSDKLRLFCTLGVVLLFFKGGEEMSAATMQQYIYFWCEDYVNSTLADLAPHTNTLFIPETGKLMTVEIAKSRRDGCGKNAVSNNTIEHQAQVLASKWGLYFSLVDAFILFFTLSLYGTLSDYVGRKPFVCLSLAGYVIKTAFYMIMIHYNLHIGYMLVSICMNAICGSSYAFSLFSYTMTADLTNGTRDRVLSITVMEILVSIGRCTTQFGNGYFIRDEGYFYPMLTAFCAATISLLITVCFLKETLPSKCNANIQSNRQYSFPKCSTLFRNYISFYIGSGEDKKLFWICLSVFFLLEFGILGDYDILTLYQLGSPFCWGSETIGLYNGVRLVVCFVLGGVLLKPAQTCLPENVITCLGLVSAIAFNVVTALARSTALLFIAIPVGILMVLPKSILRGLASSRATAHKQGAMFAARPVPLGAGAMFAGLSSSELVCKLIASPVSLALYSHTLSTMKGAVFLALAGVNLVALVIMLSSLRLFRNR